MGSIYTHTSAENKGHIIVNATATPSTALYSTPFDNSSDLNKFMYADFKITYVPTSGAPTLSPFLNLYLIYSLDGGVSYDSYEVSPVIDVVPIRDNIAIKLVKNIFILPYPFKLVVLNISNQECIVSAELYTRHMEFKLV
jgi:hypothetical protein